MRKAAHRALANWRPGTYAEHHQKSALLAQLQLHWPGGALLRLSWK